MRGLADVLEARTEVILERWAERVRPPAHWEGLTAAEWRHPVRAVLREWVTRLRPTPASRGESPGGRAHGAHRFRLGVEARSLLREYEVLRAVLCDEAEHQDVPVRWAEVQRLLDGVSTSQAEAVGEHARLKQTARQEEERGWYARLSSFVEQMPPVVAHMSGPDHVFTLVNASCRRLLGHRPILGRMVREVVPELADAYVVGVLDRVYTTGEPFAASEVDIPLRREGASSPRIVSFDYRPTRGPDGRIDGILVHGVDVTETVRARREVEAAQAESSRSRAWLATVLVSIADGVVVTDPEGRVVFLNPVAEQLSGWSLGEVLHQPSARCFPLRGPDLREPRAHPVEQVLRGEDRRVPTPSLLVCRNGAQVSVDASATPLRDEAHALTGAVLVLHDATARERERLERERLLLEAIELKALAERRRIRLYETYMRAPVAIAILRGPGLVIELANALVCQLWRRTEEQVRGRPLLEALPELRGQGFDDILHRVMSTGLPFLGTELRAQLMRGADTEPEGVYFNFIYEPLREEPDAPAGVLIVATEVTREVQARQEALRLAEEERGLRDFEQQLIGIVSHDLRNPLSAILMAVHVLRRQGPRDPRVVQSLNLIQQSTERSVRMVHDLLDFTQARLGGGIRLERAPVDIHQVSRLVVGELRASHPERLVLLEQQGDTLGEWDGDRLAQVVSNLVSNAVKYSPPDSAVTVRTVGGQEDVLLEVHNGGDPIPSEALPRLFQPLQRAADGGAGHEDRSVGLGLYIVEHIVRAHGGQVQVTSRPDAGTTFRVLLPRCA